MRDRAVIATLAGTLTLAANAVSAEWTTSTNADEMTGETQAFAFSPDVPPTKPMRFPYHDVRAWLAVGCNDRGEWAYVGFNQPPNLNNTETRDGYNDIMTRIKWDDTVHVVELRQEWGATFLHFVNPDPKIQKIGSRSKALLELNWHGNGSTYFQFPLKGSSAALDAMRAECRGA